MAERSSDASPSESCSTPQDERPTNNWWDSWISSAKSKSAEVYTMVKKDLDEIGTAVKSEASHVFNSTSNVVSKTFKLDVPESPANAMKKSFSTFIGQVSTVLNPEPDDEDDTEVILSSGDTTMLSTYKKELEKIQSVDATFLVPPSEAEFTAWLASVEGDVASPAAAARRLRASPVLAQRYHKLVPHALSPQHFWERYLFRVALLQDRLAAAARRQPAPPTDDPVLAHLPLEQHEDSPVATPILQSPQKVLSGVESDQYTSSEDITPADTAVAWEDEDFAADVELTEEQQILLLEEYEKEIASKKQPKPRDVTNNNTKTITTNTDNTNTKTKAAQTRDNLNNKTDKKEPKEVIDNKNKPKEITDNKNKPKEITDNKNKPKEITVNKNKPKDVTDNKNKSKEVTINKSDSPKKITDNKKSPKKGPKTDVCGNDLVEDYFAEKEVKDDASANSDESWEKEFEIDDVEQKA